MGENTVTNPHCGLTKLDHHSCDRLLRKPFLPLDIDIQTHCYDTPEQIRETCSYFRIQYMANYRKLK